MCSWLTFGSVLLTSMLAATLVAAAPAEVPCGSISIYTTEYFEDTANMIWVPEASTCLFYTAGNTANAARISQSSGMATIWDLFRCDLYADRSRVLRPDPSDTTGKKTLPADPSYPLRCILAPKTNTDGSIIMNPNTGNPEQSADELTYFSNMSRAMARHCDVFASLMSVAKTDPKGIPQNGIWNLVEFPELMLANNAGGTVNDIDWFDSSLNLQGELWHRISIASRTVTNVTRVTSRDNSGHVSCSDPAGFAANDYSHW